MLALCGNVEYLDLSYCNVSDNGLVRYSIDVLLLHCEGYFLVLFSVRFCVKLVMHEMHGNKENV